MCGIAGQVVYNNQRVEQNTLETLAKFMKKRGPDHSGMWFEGQVGFAHTRLAILDLDKRSNQPMSSDNEQVVLTFNGEIYNYQKIRDRLIALGHNFRTSSDTEVLVKGYQEWGVEGLISQISGMFAFAIYDKRQQKVYLGRDRFGKKPLYYYFNNQEFLFASDIRPIYKLKRSSLGLNLKAIDYYLTELSMPQPHTIWEEIKQLPAAHYACLDIPNSSLELTEYWQLNISKKNYHLSLGEAIEESKYLLQAAINRRLMSDVPLGCFLSGGVDSGLVVSLLAEMQEKPVKTFSVGLDFQEMNELPDARIVADRYATEHKEIIVKANLIEDITNLITYIGEPFADSSIIPSHLVAKAIREDVTVALSGDGGDELFGGYNDYGLAFRTYDYMKQNPNRLTRSLKTLLDKVTSRFFGKAENNGAYEAYMNWSVSKRLYRQMGFWDKNGLYQDDFKYSVERFTKDYLTEQWEKYSSDNNLIDHLMGASLHTRLLNDYLVKVDRSSMYNSLEVRSPFLDVKLLEFAFSVPAEYKFHQNINKYILKNIAEKYIDPNINARPKRGFSIPIGIWLKTNLKDWAEELLLGENGLIYRGWFNKTYIQMLFQTHQEGKEVHTHRLWALLCLEIWAREFLD